jgi:hypothetical protein
MTGMVAAPLPRTHHHHSLIDMLRAVFLTSPRDPRPPRKHYPPRRASFLEGAAAAREMHRL